MIARPGGLSGEPDVVIVEALGTGHGLRLVGTACRLGMRTTFVTENTERYCDDVDQALLEQPPPNLTVLSGVDTRSRIEVKRVLAPKVGTAAAVLAQVDRSILATAEACAELGLPFLPVDVVRRCTDKALFRKACSAAGTEYVRACSASTVSDAVHRADVMGYPLVVKPATGTASVGVRSATTPDEVAQAAAAILLGKPGQPPTVLLEEYLAGPLVSAECLRHQGTTLLLGISDRVLTAPPNFAEMCWAFPLDLQRPTTEQIARTCDRVLDAVGLDEGPAHVEMVLTSDGPRVVEVNPRMAGRGLSYIVSELASHDVYELTLRGAVGQAPTSAGARRRSGAGAEYVVSGPAGHVVDPQAIKTVRAMPGVESVRLVPGGTPVPTGDDTVDHGEVLAWGSSCAEAQLRARAGAQYLAGQLRPPSSGR
jgi:biotin carboxylase